jgi:hypothetical protein
LTDRTPIGVLDAAEAAKATFATSSSVERLALPS